MTCITYIGLLEEHKLYRLYLYSAMNMLVLKRRGERRKNVQLSLSWKRILHSRVNCSNAYAEPLLIISLLPGLIENME